jgi:hypothetical protein
LAPSVLWLACEVHFGRAALQAQRLKYGFRNSVGQTTEWSMRNGITVAVALSRCIFGHSASFQDLVSHLLVIPQNSFAQVY